MDTQTAVPHQQIGGLQVKPAPGVDRRQHADRRKEHHHAPIPDRRAQDWRRAADRMERAGRPVTALFFNNEAALVESESERHQVRGAFAVNGEMQ